MTKIVHKLAVDLDLGVFHDSCKERIEALITSKKKGVVVTGEIGEAKEAFGQKHDGEALRETQNP